MPGIGTLDAAREQARNEGSPARFSGAASRDARLPGRAAANNYPYARFSGTARRAWPLCGRRQAARTVLRAAAAEDRHGTSQAMLRTPPRTHFLGLLGLGVARPGVLFQPGAFLLSFLVGVFSAWQAQQRAHQYFRTQQSQGQKQAVAVGGAASASGEMVRPCTGTELGPDARDHGARRGHTRGIASRAAAGARARAFFFGTVETARNRANQTKFASDQNPSRLENAEAEANKSAGNGSTVPRAREKNAYWMVTFPCGGSNSRTFL